MKPISILVLISFFLAGKLFAQSGDECKYLQVYSYLKSNAQINEQLKKKLSFLKFVKKEKFVSMNVLPWIQFIGFSELTDSIHADSVGLDKVALENERTFSRTYKFEAFKSSLLEKLISRDEGVKLFLTFSKSIGSVLVVEILNSDNPPYKIRKMGGGVKVLFIFDHLGVISKYYMCQVFYN